MSKKVIANETDGAAHDKSVGTKQDPAPALEVGTLNKKQQKTSVDQAPSGNPPRQTNKKAVCQYQPLNSPLQAQPQRKPSGRG